MGHGPKLIGSRFRVQRLWLLDSSYKIDKDSIRLRKRAFTPRPVLRYGSIPHHDRIRVSKPVPSLSKGASAKFYETIKFLSSVSISENLCPIRISLGAAISTLERPVFEEGGYL